MRKFHIDIGEPNVIVQGEAGDTAWGHYQFPGLQQSNEGSILAYWFYGVDSIEGGSHDCDKKPPYVSTDAGKTWFPNNVKHTPKRKWLMPDGKYFCGFCGRGAHPLPKEWWNQYTPGIEWDDINGEYFYENAGRNTDREDIFRMYYTDELERSEDTIVKASVYDPSTGETEVYEPKINWPYAPIVCFPGNRIYPMTNMFSLSNSGILQHDNSLYICMYFHGFDSTAKTRKESVNPYNRYYSVYVFRSDDCARTWDFVSQVSIDEKTVSDNKYFEGFCEPMMSYMADGSVVMLMRTGNVAPSYIVRSTDDCKTWSEPVIFDDCGVMPQIQRLGCGVTLAGYGRPVLKLRATGDDSGIVWEDPIEIPLVSSGWKEYLEDHIDASCFYTNFLPIDDYSALWIYSEFLHPNENGDPAKAIVVRKITAVIDGN